MKKLKRLQLSNAYVLSEKELNSIEGGLVIVAYDVCTEYTIGEACVYNINGNTITLGTCSISYKQDGKKIESSPFCEK